MSLVEYDASDEEEEEEEGEEEAAAAAAEKLRKGEADREENRLVDNSRPIPPPNRHNHSVIALFPPSTGSSLSTERLPDASVLLASPSFSSNQITGNDHSSRVAAAMESASRKRESNGSAFTNRHRKLPRAGLPNSRNVPDTAGGLLIPPQLNGRSNVVTEDMGRLFVNRTTQLEPSG